MSNDGGKDFVNRFQRYDLAVPVRVRASGEREWHEAALKNVSGSGALVVGEDRLAVGAKVELWMMMRASRNGSCDIVCPSVVVRRDKAEEAQTPVGIAMKFQRYKFRPTQA